MFVDEAYSLVAESGDDPYGREAVQTLLKRMEAAGLLRRTRSSLDERRVQIALTDSGRELKAQAIKVPACVVSAAHCPVAELMALTKKVQALRRQLTA